MKKVSPWSVFVIGAFLFTAMMNYGLYKFSQIDKPEYVRRISEE